MQITDTPQPPATGKLEPSTRAPDFSLPDQTGRTVQLSNLLGHGPIVLYFYPKDNTQGCTAEARAFRDSYLVFKEAGAEVIGVSTDSEASHQGFAEQHKLPFILLSDEKGAVSKLYGARAMFGLMTGRVSYVIDASGTVRHVFNSMFNATRHVDVALWGSSASFSRKLKWAAKVTDEQVNEFWEAYLTTLPEHHPHRFGPVPAAWSFGDSAEMAGRLGKLVSSGIKTATCSRYTGKNILDDAGLSILSAGDGAPLCLIETYEITVRRYGDVDADFTAAEGEGDLSLDGWREAHWRFFSREGKIEGYDVNVDMLLSCERFRVLYLVG